MSEDFDRFLASALAPAERGPDRGFVGSVQMRIALEERLAAERRSLSLDLLKQLAGLVAIAAAIVCLARAAPVADFSAQSPALVLAILLIAFAFVIALLSMRGSTDRRRLGQPG